MMASVSSPLCLVLNDVQNKPALWAAFLLLSGHLCRMWAELWQLQWLDNSSFRAACIAQTMMGLFLVLPQIAAVLVWGFKTFMYFWVREGMKKNGAIYDLENEPYFITLDVWLWATLLTFLSLNLFICKMRRLMCMNFKVPSMYEIPCSISGALKCLTQIVFNSFFLFLQVGNPREELYSFYFMFKKWVNSIPPCLICPVLNSLCSLQNPFLPSIPHVG